MPSFVVLFVCTGNICRSPMGERLLRARVADAVDLVSFSAGTAGLTGHAMDLPSAVVLRALGGDPEGHVARRLSERDVASADLVLTADEGHRSKVLQLLPLAFRRTFTMREFARLGAGLQPPASDLSGDELRQRVGSIAGQRGFAPPPASGEDDIGDPFAASTDVARRVGGEISDTVDATISALGLPRR